GVRHQRQHARRVALPVPRRVEPAEGLDGLRVGAVPALRVGAELPDVRERARHLDAARGEPRGEVLVAPDEEDGEVAPVDDVEPAPDARVHEVLEVRVELGRTAGEVHGVERVVRAHEKPVDGREAGVHRGPVHGGVGAVGAGIDVAVPARQVAELPDVDLEDLERRRRERGPAARGEVGVEAAGAGGAARDRDGAERAELLGGRGQRRPARAEARRALRAGLRRVEPQLAAEHGQVDEAGIGGVAHPAHIILAFAWSSIWRPWTSEAPPRIAVATWTASVICSRSAPFSSDSAVYASMQYGHCTVWATASAMSAFSRAVSAPSSKTCP